MIQEVVEEVVEAAVGMTVEVAEAAVMGMYLLSFIFSYETTSQAKAHSLAYLKLYTKRACSNLKNDFVDMCLGYLCCFCVCMYI